MQNLRDVLSAKPKILHFSGHGEQDKGNGDNDFLIIERDDLRNENLTGKMIRDMFWKNKEEDDKIRLAVVLSCHSQKVGEIFAKAGVGHVVCIKREWEVADQAWLTFAKTFYNYLLYGEECSVWEAFQHGKKVVSHKFKPTEADKFLWLWDHQNKTQDCVTFFQLEKGDSRNRSVKTKIEALPDRYEELLKNFSIERNHIILFFFINSSFVSKFFCILDL